MDYQTKEIWCRNGAHRIYGIAYIPRTGHPCPLVIFSSELGNSHTSGIRYAERLAAHGYAAYVFDFCGGSAPGVENRSDGSPVGMSVMTEKADLEAVLAAAGSWDFVDPRRIFLLGGSQGGLVSIVTCCAHPDELAGMILMYPALSVKDDAKIMDYPSIDAIPEQVDLFGGWMRVGRNYVTDILDVDFYALLSSCTTKFLLLHGDEDTTVDLSYSERAARIAPMCEFHVIHGGRHEFHGQPFEDAIAYILRYLDETK